MISQALLERLDKIKGRLYEEFSKADLSPDISDYQHEDKTGMEIGVDVSFLDGRVEASWFCDCLRGHSGVVLQSGQSGMCYFAVKPEGNYSLRETVRIFAHIIRGRIYSDSEGIMEIHKNDYFYTNGKRPDFADYTVRFLIEVNKVLEPQA